MAVYILQRRIVITVYLAESVLLNIHTPGTAFGLSL